MLVLRSVLHKRKYSNTRTLDGDVDHVLDVSEVVGRAAHVGGVLEPVLDDDDGAAEHAGADAGHSGERVGRRGRGGRRLVVRDRALLAEQVPVHLRARHTRRPLFTAHCSLLYARTLTRSLTHSLKSHQRRVTDFQNGPQGDCVRESC